MTPITKPALLLVLYGLSGVTALAYEVLWTRMLSLLFGVSIVGVVVTVAAFMLGLGLGSWLGHRWQVDLKTSLRSLAMIELAVALYALFLPTMMQFVQMLYVSVDDVSPWQFWQMSSALLVLSVPAMALGFAFPWMLRVGKACSLSLSQLYGVNTLGGAIGALLPLLLLPSLGWTMALQTVAGLGALIAIVLFFLSLKVSNQAFNKTTVARFPTWSVSLAYAGMGAAALMLEMAWTRAYGMILLRTEYVLAVILFIFLMGIGLGSLWVKYLPRRLALQYLPWLMGFMALLGLYAFPLINGLGQSVNMDTLLGTLLFQGGLIALCTLPITLALGAWLPLIADKEHGAALYAVNSLGACAGALLAGFVFIPWLGTAATWLLAAASLMLCAFYWLGRPNRLQISLFAAWLLLAWPVSSLPPAAQLLAKELPNAVDLWAYEDAVSITHVVERNDGERVLLADLQRMDAASDATSVAVQKNQARLPMFLHGHANEVLFLGLGTGITASGALPWTNANIHAVELSAGSVQAARDYFSLANAYVMNRIEVEHDDARRYLMRSKQHYDVIVGDLFHPDMVGRGALLSVEQQQRAKQHLKQDGVFVQWLAFNQFDVAAMQVVLRSFEQVFTHNALFVDGFRMALVGFNGAQPDALTLIKAAPKDALWGGEGAWTWLGRYWGDIHALLRGSNGLTVQGEWSPVIEYSLPHMRYEQGVLQDVLHWLLIHRPSFQSAMQTWQVPQKDWELFKRAWAASSFNLRAQWASLQGQDAMRLQMLAYQANPHDRWAAFAVADMMFASLKRGIPKNMSYKQALEKVLSIRPDHVGALKALLVLARKENSQDEVQKYTQQLRMISPYARLPQ